MQTNLGKIGCNILWAVRSRTKISLWMTVANAVVSTQLKLVFLTILIPTPIIGPKKQFAVLSVVNDTKSPLGPFSGKFRISLAWPCPGIPAPVPRASKSKVSTQTTTREQSSHKKTAPNACQSKAQISTNISSFSSPRITLKLRFPCAKQCLRMKQKISKKEKTYETQWKQNEMTSDKNLRKYHVVCAISVRKPAWNNSAR